MALNSGTTNYPNDYDLNPISGSTATLDFVIDQERNSTTGVITVSGTQIKGLQVNSPYQSIQAIQETLGINPQGAYSTVGEALENAAISGNYVKTSGGTITGDLEVSGSSIIPVVSGTSTIGTEEKPFAVVYADDFVDTSGVSNFVKRSGDTMTGDLTMASGSNVLTDSSGVNTVGSATLPFEQIFTKTLNATNLSGLSPINISADTINMNSDGTVNTTVGSSSMLVANTGEASPGVVLTHQSAKLDMSDADSVKFHSNNSDNNITIGTTLGIDIETNSESGDIAISTFGSGSSITLVGDADNNGGERSVLELAGGNVNISGNIFPFSSGTHDIGSPALPFRKVYADEIVDTSGSSIYVEKAGDTMDGNLNFASGIGITSDNTLSVLSTNDLNLTSNGETHIYAPTDFIEIGDSSLNKSYANIDQANGEFSLATSGVTASIYGQTNLITTTATTIRQVGDVVISGDVTPFASGTQSIGSPALPWSGVYSNTIYQSGTDISDLYVNVSGDTMTGDLELNGAALKSAPGQDLMISGNNGDYIKSDNATAFFDIYSAAAGLNITSAGGEMKLLNTGGATVTVSGTPVIIRSEPNYLSVSPSEIEIKGTLRPAISGTVDIGSAALPFRRVYADEIVDTSGGSIYVEKAGDTMTGALKMEANIQLNGDLTIGSAGAGQSINVGASSGLSIGGGDGGVVVNASQDVSIGASGKVTIGSTNPVEFTQSVSMKNGDLNFDNGTDITSSEKLNITASSGTEIGGASDFKVNLGGDFDVTIGGRVLLQPSSNIELGNNVLPTASGTQDIGSVALPFDTLYVNAISGVTLGGGGYDGPATSTDRGILTWSGTGADTVRDNSILIDTDGNLTPTTSGTLTLGTPALPFSGIYVENVNNRNVVIPVNNEVPSGLVNGVTENFELANTPTINSVQLFNETAYMYPSGVSSSREDYSIISGNIIHFAAAPTSGNSLIANYTYQG